MTFWCSSYTKLKLGGRNQYQGVVMITKIVFTFAIAAIYFVAAAPTELNYDGCKDEQLEYLEIIIKM